MKRQYTEKVKRVLVAQYATGIAPVQTLAKTAGVSKTTFYEWIHLFGDGSATLSEKEFSAIHFRRVQQLLERERLSS